MDTGNVVQYQNVYKKSSCLRKNIHILITFVLSSPFLFTFKCPFRTFSELFQNIRSVCLFADGFTFTLIPPSILRSFNCSQNKVLSFALSFATLCHSFSFSFPRIKRKEMKVKKRDSTSGETKTCSEQKVLRTIFEKMSEQMEKDDSHSSPRISRCITMFCSVFFDFFPSTTNSELHNLMEWNVCNDSLLHRKNQNKNRKNGIRTKIRNATKDARGFTERKSNQRKEMQTFVVILK